MVEYTWKVTGVDCLPEYKKVPEFVQHVYWICEGTDGEFSSSFNGSSQLPVGKAPYKSFGELTEDVVLGWAFDEMGGFRQEVEAKVAAHIADQAAPAIVTPPLPWAKVEEAEESEAPQEAE